MRHFLFFALSLLVLSACKDETLAGYAPRETIWIWQELDGQPAPARASLRLHARGLISGQAPCNSFSAQQSAPYPWFQLGPIASTKMICPERLAEERFFTALREMTLAEISGSTLLLTNDAGREMLFTGAP